MLASVKDMVSMDGSWNLDLIREFVDEELVDEIAGTIPPSNDQGADVWTWRYEPDGRFSIRTAYDIVVNLGTPQQDVNWKLVWKWVGPGRVQYFLWLMAHGTLLTNAERKHRHMSDDDLCPRCRSASETILHVLRDCPFANEVWTNLGYSSSSPIRQGSCHSDWIKNILMHEDAMRVGIGCWFLWKARNERLFAGNNQSAASLAYRIKNWILQVNSAKQQQDIIGVERPERVRKDIAWEPGEAGWTILNTDGSVLPRNSSAAAGGLFRTGDGRCLLAFCANLGKCTIMKAELRGMFEGLRLAWENQFHKVAVRVDSCAIISLILDEDNPTHQNAREVNSI
ncbi:Putative ribonuclease H protein At1g65750 [Linum perenne]